MRLKHLLSVFLTLLTLSVGQMWGAAASLPFSYDGGSSTSTTGLTCSGLGSNYSSSPKMKLDHAGDYVMVQFSNTPDKLGYKLKTNGSGSGTFKFEVLQSADGSSWSEVKTYNSTPSGTATESNIQLSSSSRYVKFIYTTKVSGINMGLGAISISKATASKTLSSIAITTQPTKREYLVGQTFSSTGAVVRATYSDASTANITATWTPTTALTAGT